MNDLISVIVPVFNIADYLRNSIESLLRQTYGNLEIIAVDDGSTDNSLEVLQEIARMDPRLRIIHQENGGVSSARLSGVSAASGDWIGFMDGDDWVEPDMYEHLLQNALKYQADISHCGYRMVFPDRVDFYFNTGKLLKQNSRDAVWELLGGSFEPSLCNKLFRRSLLQRYLLEINHNTVIRINEDLLMNFYLFRFSQQSVFEDFCPYYYMARKGSAVKSSIKSYKLEDPIKVRRILMTETEEDPELYACCYDNYVACLIRTATIAKKGKNKDIQACITTARRNLKAAIPDFLRNPFCSKKLKLFSSWASIWPESYRIVHHIYGEVTGINHKYEIK